MPDDPIERSGPIEGRAQQVRVTLTDLSFRRTSAGRRYAYPDFGSDLIQALHEGLVGPRRRGLLRSTLVCPSCERSLEGIAVEPVIASTDVDLSRIPTIHIELEMPGMVCPGCDRHLVMIGDRGVESDLSDALIDAFQQAGIAPG